MNEEKAIEYAKLAIERLINETRTKTLGISLTDEKPALLDSKIGGIPYLPKNVEIPVDKNNRQMRLLAQINCSDLNLLDAYPHNGILQFWLTTNNRWNEYSVRYYSDTAFAQTEEEILRKIETFHDGTEGAFPVNGEYGVAFKLGEETMGRDDKRLKALFCQYYTEISGEYISDPEDAGDGEYGQSVYEVFEGYRDRWWRSGSKIGGYEDRTQLVDYLVYRPKEYAASYSSSWCRYVEEIDMKSDDELLLLFQLKSYYRNSSDYRVLWGDAGIGRFYIKRKDLRNCDFSKVWFEWDCS